MRKEYLIKFLNEFQYPEEAKNAFCNAYDKIKKYPELEKYLSVYENGEALDFVQASTELEELSEGEGVNKYTTRLLFHILLTQKLRQLYKEKGISDTVFFDSLSDLKYKAIECYNVHKVWGSFTSRWFNGFYTLERFAFGRLQFEVCGPAKAYDKGNVHIGAGDQVINVHIPSSGPLKHEECIKAYKQAYQHYKKYAKDGIICFQCHSWLLEPALEELIDESSNIIKFKRDYDVYHVDKRGTFPDAWRVFLTSDGVDVKDYPENTLLQKRIKEYLLNGNTIGYGLGIMKFDGEKVIY